MSAHDDIKLLDTAHDLIRRMPPSTLLNSIAGLLQLQPDLADTLLSTVDQPLQLRKDEHTGTDYIICDYNRDGDSYRSPWSNQYYPAITNTPQLSHQLRLMEVDANKVFELYKRQYFDTGYSSVYMFETNNENEENIADTTAVHAFGAIWLIHKPVQPAAGSGGGKTDMQSGVWDSIHVFDVKPVEGKKNVYTYTLTTTVIVSLKLSNTATIGNVDLGGSMTVQDSKQCTLDEYNTHIVNMGTFLEDSELRVRNAVEGIYIQKTREVIHSMRSLDKRIDTTWKSITATLREAAGESPTDKQAT